MTPRSKLLKVLPILTMILVVATILITTVVLEQAIMTMVEEVMTTMICRLPKERKLGREQMSSFALQPINLV